MNDKEKDNNSINGSVQSFRINDHEEDLSTVQIDPKEEKKLVRKLDLFICPVLGFSYFLSFLDRSNIGNAASGGMVEDLNNMPSNGINIATSVFYVLYVLFEAPLSSLMKRFPVRYMMSAILILWGAVVIGSGFQENFATLVALRLILGAFEAALFPCLAIYITFFYKRNEIAFRTAMLFVAAAISSAFGGLISSGLLQLNGGGLKGWQILYLFEGLLTVVWGIVLFFLLAEDSQSAWYLNEREKYLMQVRYAHGAKYQFMGDYKTEVKKCLKDPAVYYSCIAQLGADTCLFGYSTFLVLIIQDLGFNYVNANLLSAANYCWAAIVYVICAMVADRYNHRVPMLITASLITVAGYAILLGVDDIVGVQYFACFVCGTGIYVTVGLNLTMWNTNASGVTKRSTGMGMNQSFGNIGGIIAGQIYTTNRIGHAVSMSVMAMSCVLYAAQWVNYTARNKRKEAMTQEEKDEQDRNGVTGDERYDFKYVM
ncbi:hypothetical protein E3P86_02851 [Wallemia ichthyophaga]|uniref:Major facilitator superfamily (MFS) profile domain-containing protein n=1 Tax=Wallemia ichthyophaga TaxID=245174 RepID=A0A4V4M4Z2_WALIC|nr:hypothetical protein E3P86_02851 [Wallemia ichthyophaga]